MDNLIITGTFMQIIRNIINNLIRLAKFNKAK